MLLLGLMAALVSSCGLMRGPSTYRVQLPVLGAQPLTVPCEVGDHSDVCILVLKRDYETIVRELKAACLALGQTPAACQAEQ